MNDHAILEQIAQNPKCRAVQLADRLDVELEDVQAALAGLIAVGDVVATPGTSPAGAPCQLYDLSEKFRTSDAYAPIAAKAAAVQFREQHPTLGNVALAVAFVQQRGTATSAELHTLLGLKPGEYASVTLSSAVQNERLIKDGKNWTLGPKAFPDVREPDRAQARAAQAKPDVSESGAELGRVEKPVPANFPVDDVKAMAGRRIESRAKAKPDALVTGADLSKLEPEPKPVLQVPTFTANQSVEGAGLKALKDALKPSRYRCALWSDGQIEVQRDGVKVAELPRDVAEEVARFVGSLA